MTLTDTFELIGSAEAERSYSKAMRWRYGYGRGRRNAERSTDHASFDGAIAHFVDCLRTRAPFERDAADNLATLRLIEAGDLTRAAAVTSVTVSCGGARRHRHGRR